MQNCFLSIIIVTLNPGDLLEKTILSILGQNFEDYEVIVKDGVSNDGSMNYVPRDDKRFNIHQIADSGIYDAMNQAIPLARGKYILFLNSGDTFEDNKAIETIRKHADQSSDPRVVIFGYTDHSSNYVRKYPQKLSSFFIFRLGICHQSVAYRNISNDSSFSYDLRLRIRADIDFTIRNLNNGNYTVIDEMLVGYLGNGFSAQKSLAALKNRERTIVQRRHFSKIQFIIYTILHEATLWRVRGFIRRKGGNILGRLSSFSDR